MLIQAEALKKAIDGYRIRRHFWFGGQYITWDGTKFIDEHGTPFIFREGVTHDDWEVITTYIPFLYAIKEMSQHNRTIRSCTTGREIAPADTFTLSIEEIFGLWDIIK